MILYSEEEYLLYAKDKYDNFKSKQLATVRFIVFIIIVAFIAIYNYNGDVIEIASLIVILALLFIVAGVSIASWYFTVLDINSMVANGIRKKGQAMTIIQQTYGDYSPAIISQGSVEILNQVKQDNLLLYNEFDRVTNIVKNSNDSFNAELWNDFLEEYNTKNRKTILNSIWSNLKTRIPELIGITASLLEIAKLVT